MILNVYLSRRNPPMYDLDRRLTASSQLTEAQAIKILNTLGRAVRQQRKSDKGDCYAANQDRGATHSQGGLTFDMSGGLQTA
jgi:hypothetical protein